MTAQSVGVNALAAPIQLHGWQVKRYLSGSDVEHFSACMYAYCSNMAKLGMKSKILQYLMGHLYISCMMNVYTHIELDDAAEELKRLEKF